MFWENDELQYSRHITCNVTENHYKLHIPCISPSRTWQSCYTKYCHNKDRDVSYKKLTYWRLIRCYIIYDRYLYGANDLHSTLQTVHSHQSLPSRNFQSAVISMNWPYVLVLKVGRYSYGVGTKSRSYTQPGGKKKLTAGRWGKYHIKNHCIKKKQHTCIEVSIK